MGMYKFMMSCGHEDTREVADPTKYFTIDKEYYRKQGLCDECWKGLHEQAKKRQEEQTEKAIEIMKGAVKDVHNSNRKLY